MSDAENRRNPEEEFGADKIEGANRRGADPQPTPKPSQAEGEPDTVDAALQDQEEETPRQP